jgi:diguanylate cyclase (GGDEF)-like protein
VLLVEDNPGDAGLLRETLKDVPHERFELVHVKRLGEALERLKVEPVDVILLDLSLPDAKGIETIVQVRKHATSVPVIVMTGFDDESMALTALQNGAQDYLVKGQIAAPLLGHSIRYAIERQRAEQLIQQRAFHDELTELPNRNLFYDRLEQAIRSARREQRNLPLLFMDLDRFKEINEALGHPVGDQLLRQIGPRLRETLRESDTVARLGGDEFAVLLPSSGDAQDATEVARRVLQSLEQPFVIDGVKLDVEGSIGIAVFPEHGADADALIRKAEVAMYTAKTIGSGFAVYAAELDNNSSRRLTLVAELRQAIVENQLLLLYQPKVGLQTGLVREVEALVRWHHPSFGMLRPDEFIPLAERTGLIRPLTLWVLKEALRQSRAWRKQGLDIKVAVNISRRNLQAQELADQIDGILRAAEMTPDSLKLEITESAIMAKPERAMATLARLKNLGLQVSLDDFGTGYSSLAALKKLPVDELKIDKSFVFNMEGDEQDVAIVRLIINLGHVLGLKVVAEGVENRRTMDVLIAIGCDEAQGFYISRPISAAELSHKLLADPNCFNKDTTAARSKFAEIGMVELANFAAAPLPITRA